MSESPVCPICTTCARRSGAEIVACAIADAGCAYHGPAAVAERPSTKAPVLGDHRTRLALGALLILLAAALTFVAVMAPGITGRSLLIGPIVVAVIWAVRRRRTHTFTLTDDARGTALHVTTWPHARRPAIYRWCAPAEPVALELTPLAHDAPVSVIAAAVIARGSSKVRSVSMDEAVSIARQTLVGLVRDGRLILHKRAILIATGAKPLQPMGATYTLLRAPQPAAPPQRIETRLFLEARMLGAFLGLPADASLTAEALIWRVYGQQVGNPAHHLWELAHRPERVFSPAQRAQLQEALAQRQAELTARYPQLALALEQEIGRAIRLRQVSDTN